MISRFLDIFSRLRDRRTRERKRLEEIFDRKTLMAVAVILPLQKAIELVIIGELELAARFVVLFALASVVAVYWKKVSEAATDAAETVEETAKGEN